jgi:hypothetical protein
MGQFMYHPNKDDLLDIVASLNFHVLEDMVPEEGLSFFIDDLTDQDVWGYCIPSEEEDSDDIILAVHNAYETKEQFFRVVAHELLHAVQIYNEMPVGHEGRFYEEFSDALEAFISSAEGYDMLNMDEAA